MDALILAGGPAPPELCTATGCPDRALIPLLDQPMVARVLAALRATPGVEKIAVAGSAQTLSAVSGVVPVEAGGRMVDNLLRGLAATSSESVIVCTCDIPLVTGATFEAFVHLAKERHLELAYPIVQRTTSEAAFPGGQRTYARLSDGEFTGGNAVIVPRRIVQQVVELIDVAYNARKNPMALAKILGPAFVMKFLSKRLSIAEVELKASRVLGCRAGAVVMADASIAFDVDKPADLEVARRALSARTT